MSDLITWACILIALYYVPRYLWRVYGGPPIGAWIVSGLRTLFDGSHSIRAGSDTSSERAVPAQQHQSAPELVLDFEGVLDYLRRHNLTDEQVIDLLTLIRRESGDLLSANKIRDIVGGNEAQVKARVAGHRPKPIQPQARRLERPVNGWGKAS